ncbi:MAG: Hsp33 family molecular chaperone HslO [Cardiobacteriaceae bacterium]|nr:Hsp33 family molecular chaperone HslO [Cardiobacteriaceae bacterium]
MSDLRHRFLFDTLPVRGLHVQLEQSWQTILSHANYPTPIQSALGELLAAGALLSSNLKIDGVLTLQIQPRGEKRGVVSLMVVESNSEQNIRATARFDDTQTINPNASLQDLVGDEAVFVLTFQPKDGEAWQGIVPLEGKNVAEILMNYMARSEQLETHLTLAADEKHCSGLLLQRLPEAEPSPDAWEYVTALAETITTEELLELSAEKLLYRLYHETPPRLFAPDTLRFACTCNEDKIRRTLLFLGWEEVQSILEEQGNISIGCDFCHRQFHYNETQAKALFTA